MKTKFVLIALAVLSQFAVALGETFADKAKETVLRNEIDFDQAAPKEVLDFISKESGIPVFYTPPADAAKETHITMGMLPAPVTADDALNYAALLANLSLTYEKDGAHFASKTDKGSEEPAPGDTWVRVVAAKPFSIPQGAGMFVFLRYSLQRDGGGVFGVPYYKGKQSPQLVARSQPLRAGTGGCVRFFLSPGKPLPVDEVRGILAGGGTDIHSEFPVTFDGTVPLKTVKDLSEIKTPGLLWVYILQLRNHGAASPDELKETQHSIQLATEDFQKRFPKSPLVWDVRLDDAKANLDSPTGKPGLDPAKGEAELRQISAAEDASEDVKTEASFLLARIDVKNAADDAGVAGVVTAYRRDHGADWEDNTLHRLLGARFPRGEEAKMEPVLTVLEKSDDKEIAAQATDAMRVATSWKRLAELKTKPLDLKFTAVDGSEVDIANLRGKVVLVDFWATWCVPCLLEMPNVIKAYNKYHDKGFEIIGISLDRRMDKDKLIQMTRQRGMVWPQYFDGKFWNNEFSSSYGIMDIPAMWLVDKKGMVVNLQAGSGLEANIEKLLAE